MNSIFSRLAPWLLASMPVVAGAQERLPPIGQAAEPRPPQFAQTASPPTIQQLPASPPRTAIRPVQYTEPAPRSRHPIPSRLHLGFPSQWLWGRP